MYDVMFQISIALVTGVLDARFNDTRKAIVKGRILVAFEPDNLSINLLRFNLKFKLKIYFDYNEFSLK